MKKLFFATVAVLCAAAAFAQNDARALPDLSEQRVELSLPGAEIPVGPLVIRRNASYRIGGVPISRRELLRDVAPAIPGLAEEIRRGVATKWGAVGLGVAAPFGLYFGFALVGYSAVGGDYSGMMAGLGIMAAGLGCAGGCVAFSIVSVRSQRRAMRIYDNAFTYSTTPPQNAATSSATIAMSTTRGGLGVQFTF